jgi:hypothetical protein
MSTSLENKLKNLMKQNDAIYNSLLVKNILFERVNINDQLSIDDKIILLSEENEKLKNISKNNRPPPEVKAPKPQVIVETKKKNVEENEEENYEPVKKNFSTIANMEDIKRAFFNKDYQLFNELIKNFNFKYYRVEYKYSNEKDGAPEFIAKNLVKGFVRNLDDYRKYFMICFRCYKNENNSYSYPSLWIVNSNDDIKDIIESIYDDYIYNEETDIESFLRDIQKIDDEKCIEEAYVH